MQNGIGLAIWNFTQGTLSQRILHCAEEGFDFVSLIGQDAASLCRGECQDVEDIILQTSLGVTIHASMMSGFDPIPPESLLEDFNAFLAWHGRTSRLACIHYDPARTRNGAYLSSHMRNVLKEMLACAARTGVKVGVEDWPVTQDQLAACEDLAQFEHFGLLIDLGHLNIRLRRQHGLDVPFPVEAAQDFFRRLLLPVNELHIHNNNGERDQHAPLFKGTADMSALAEILVQMRVRCLSTIEIVPAWCGLDNKQGWQEARKAAEFWRQAYLAAIS